MNAPNHPRSAAQSPRTHAVSPAVSRGPLVAIDCQDCEGRGAFVTGGYRAGDPNALTVECESCSGTGEWMVCAECHEVECDCASLTETIVTVDRDGRAYLRDAA